MKPTQHLFLAGAFLAAASSVNAAVVTNNDSTAAGDKANISAWSFKATAGTYPDSVTPPGALAESQTFSLDSITLKRPNDTVTPAFGVNGVQTTDATTPVYVDVYATRSGNATYSDYLGSSTNGIAFADTTQNTPYSFTFSGIALDKDTKYWLVFSETNTDGDVANFRARVNLTGDDATSGEGRGYLIGDTAQTESAAAGGTVSIQDWGVGQVAEVSAPEPVSLSLLGAGALGLLARRRRRAAR